MRGEGYSLSDIAAATGNGNGFGGDMGAWWIIIIIVLFGWGRNGFNNGGNDGGSLGTIPYFQSLDTDFATIERKLDSVNNGICDSTFALNNTINNGFAGVQQTLCQGFNGLNAAYLQGTNALSSQIANCCCGIERGIDGINYNNAINTNTISRQISDCCCNLEKMNMQSRFDAQAYNCNTLQAIDKLGDRIIDRLTQDKIETLTNENQALRLSASQSAQNEYILNSLRTGCPVNAQILSPSTPVPIRYIDAGCGCNCGCNC